MRNYKLLMKRIGDWLKQVVARHNATGEKIFAHPIRVILRFKFVGIFMMRENMHEQFPLWLEPVGNVRHQPLIILHVLEHLHRNHAVKFLVNVKPVHVTGDNAEIIQAAFLRLAINVDFLRGGIGNAGDF